MKQTKKRVLALDYFRGVLILVILLSHSHFITMPFAYVSGLGALWVSAAEMLFLISGITFGISRGQAVIDDFSSIVRRSWSRARDLYLLYIVTALFTVLIASYISSPSFLEYINLPHSTNGFGILLNIITFHHPPGLANFLGYFAIYLLCAPFVTHVLYKYRRAWVGILAASSVLFVLNTTYPFHFLKLASYTWVATWQLYFVIGLIIARFRSNIVAWYKNAGGGAKRIMYRSMSVLSLTTLIASTALAFNILPTINKLIIEGWLPHKIGGAYIRLLNHDTTFSLLLMNSRTGILRPVIALLWLSTAYLVYNKHQAAILDTTGKFIIAMGQNTLWIFVGQAIIIPLMILLPINSQSILVHGYFLVILVGSMWLVTKNQILVARVKQYLLDWQKTYYEAKQAAVYGRQDDTA